MRKECLEQAGKVYASALAVQHEVVLVYDLLLYLHDVYVNCVNDEEGWNMILFNLRRRGRACRASMFAKARLAFMSMIWLKCSSCMGRQEDSVPAYLQVRGKAV